MPTGSALVGSVNRQTAAQDLDGLGSHGPVVQLDPVALLAHLLFHGVQFKFLTFTNGLSQHICIFL